LGQHAGAITGTGVVGHSTAMFKAAQSGQSQLKNIVACPTVDASHETDATGIVLKARIVKSGWVSRRKVHCWFLDLH
jgi:hypothetical protein